jgi:hypothetical protein
VRTPPVTAAAVTGPAPDSPVRLVRAARTAMASFFLVPPVRVPVPRRSSVNPGGEFPAGRLHGARRRDRCQDLRGLACGDLLGYAAGHQLAQHGVQRQATRARPRSRWRLGHTFSTAA